MSKILTLAGLALIATTAAVSAQNRTLPAGDYWAFNPPIDQWHRPWPVYPGWAAPIEGRSIARRYLRQYPSINIAKDARAHAQVDACEGAIVT
jgi:hypothetical protein